MEIEKEVILLMSQGDEKAYGIMFRKFYPKVHRFVSMLLKNMEVGLKSYSTFRFRKGGLKAQCNP